MKRFLLKVFIFVVLLAAVDLLAGNIFMLRNSAKSGMTGKVNYLMNDFSQDILILGSSRAGHHLDPEVLEDSLGMTAYNGAIDGNGIILASGLYKGAVKHHKPKLVVYELTTTFEINENDNIPYLQYLKPYYDLEDVRNLFEEVSPLENFKNRFSLYRLNSYLVPFVKNTFHKSRMRIDNGFMSENRSMDYEPKPVILEPQGVDSLKLHLLEKLIEDARKENIKVVFTISPMYNYADTAQYKRLVDYVKARGVRVLYHLEDTAFVGKKQYFSDRTHLNTSGAEKFTKIISHEIKTIK